MRRLFIPSSLIILLVAFTAVIKHWHVKAADRTLAHTLLGCAMEGDVEGVESFLDQGVDPNLLLRVEHAHPAGYWQGPALVAAAWEGRSNVVEALLKRGAKVDLRARGYLAGIIGENLSMGSSRYSGRGYACGTAYMTGVFEEARRDTLGVTALMAAALRGDLDVVEILLAHGAGVQLKTFAGATPLMLAAMRSKTEVVRLLLARGSDANALTEDKVTALMLAAWNELHLEPSKLGDLPIWNDQLDTVQLLLESGAEINSRAHAGDTPLIGASRLHHSTRVVRLLLDRGAEINAADEDGKTALMYAASSNNVETMRALLNSGADIHQRNKDGRTALTYAAESTSPEMTRILLESGADLAALDNSGRTALMYAASEMRNERAVKVLLDRGASVNARDADGRTPLMYSLTLDSPETTKLLLKRGASVNARDNDGHTALMDAAWDRYYPDVLSILIDAGADLNAKNNRGHSAIRYAAVAAPHWELQNPECTFYHLKKAGAVIDPDTAFIIAARTGDLQAVRTMCEKGADVNLRGPGGKTVLSYAAEEGKDDAIRILLEHGTDVNARDYDGETALMRAALNDCVVAVQVLLEHGANIDAQSDDGKTALMIAAGRGRAATVRVLLAAGARLDLMSRQGDTALSVATYGEATQLIKDAGR